MTTNKMNKTTSKSKAKQPKGKFLVKVVKAKKKTYWYSNAIGKKFTVVDMDRWNYEIVGGVFMFLKSDVEVLKEI